MSYTYEMNSPIGTVGATLKEDGAVGYRYFPEAPTGILSYFPEEESSLHFAGFRQSGDSRLTFGIVPDVSVLETRSLNLIPKKRESTVCQLTFAGIPVASQIIYPNWINNYQQLHLAEFQQYKPYDPSKIKQFEIPQLGLSVSKLQGDSVQLNFNTINGRDRTIPVVNLESTMGYIGGKLAGLGEALQMPLPSGVHDEAHSFRITTDTHKVFWMEIAGKIVEGARGFDINYAFLTRTA